MTTADLAEKLTRALQAQSIPIEGVSIDDAQDRRTWTPKYAPEATAQQRAAGAAIIAAFDADAPNVKAAVETREAEAIAHSRMIRAFYLFACRKFLGKDPTPEERTADLAELVRAYKETPETL